VVVGVVVVSAALVAVFEGVLFVVVVVVVVVGESCVVCIDYNISSVTIFTGGEMMETRFMSTTLALK